MKRRILLLLYAIVWSVTMTHAASDETVPNWGTQVVLHINYDDLWGSPVRRSPALKVVVYYNGSTFTFRNLNSDYVLTITDMNGNSLFTAYLPAGTQTCDLPSGIEGAYEIKLSSSTSSYWGYLE